MIDPSDEKQEAAVVFNSLVKWANQSPTTYKQDKCDGHFATALEQLHATAQAGMTSWQAILQKRPFGSGQTTSGTEGNSVPLE